MVFGEKRPLMWLRNGATFGVLTTQQKGYISKWVRMKSCGAKLGCLDKKSVSETR